MSRSRWEGELGHEPGSPDSSFRALLITKQPPCPPCFLLSLFTCESPATLPSARFPSSSSPHIFSSAPLAPIYFSLPVFYSAAWNPKSWKLLRSIQLPLAPLWAADGLKGRSPNAELVQTFIF